METVLRTVLAHYDGTHPTRCGPQAQARHAPAGNDSRRVSRWTRRLCAKRMVSSEAAFARVWENEEDAAYDHL